MANRTPVLLGSGIASAGGVFIGSGINISGTGEGADALSGQSHEYNVPGTQHSRLVKDNYFLNIPLSRDMGGRITQTTQIEEDRNLNFSSHKCFQNFFPGAELVHTRENNDARRSVNVSNKAAPSTSNNKSAIGCSTMQLSYLQGQSEDGKKDIITGMLFKSEIVAKNENEGLALGTTGYAKDGKGKQSDKGRQYLTYRFVYLSKKADDTGEVKGGYEGENAVATIVNISAYIKVPNNNLGLDTTKLEPSRSNMWEYKEFAGIGRETNDSEGKGIFNDVEVRIADDTKCEVMCQGFVNFSSDTRYDAGFKTAQYQYSPTEKKGFYLESDENKKEKEIPALLDSYYSGIEKKKGKGEDLRAMCASQAKAKVEDDSEGKVKEDLINFCYSKKK